MPPCIVVMYIFFWSQCNHCQWQYNKEMFSKLILCLFSSGVYLKKKKNCNFFQVRKEKTTTNFTCESIILFQVAATVVVFSVIFKSWTQHIQFWTKLKLKKQMNERKSYRFSTKFKCMKKIHETNWNTNSWKLKSKKNKKKFHHKPLWSLAF